MSNDRHLPPGPPGPTKQWPSVFPPAYIPKGGPVPPPPAPYGPPFPCDTEPVLAVRPWETCCEDAEDCGCYTSGDQEMLYDVYDTVFEHSAKWEEEHDQSWKDSADFWNENCMKVSDSADYWNRAVQFTDEFDSGALAQLEKIVAKSSAFLDKYGAQTTIYTDGTYIEGDGTSANPIELSAHVRKDLTDLIEALLDLYEGGQVDESTRKWLSTAAIEKIEEWIKYHEHLFWDPSDEEVVDPDKKTRSNTGVFDQLEKIWAIIGDGYDPIYTSGAPVVLDKSLTMENYEKTPKNGIVYFNYYTES